MTWMLFPLSGSTPTAGNISWLRAIITAVTASIVQWFTVNSLFCLSACDIPWDTGARWAIKTSLCPWRACWPEQIVFVSLFFGGMWLFAGLAMLLGRLLLRHRVKPGLAVWATLVKGGLLGTQAWAAWWLLLLVLSGGLLAESPEAFLTMTIVPSLILMVMTAVRSTHLVLSQQSQAASTLDG